jgi:hypothetical protein
MLRDVAQLGSAPALGAGCRRFKSCHPDFLLSKNKAVSVFQSSVPLTALIFNRANRAN